MKSANIKLVQDYLRGNRARIISFLSELTEIESPSTVPESQIEIRNRIAQELQNFGMKIIRVPGRTSGGMLYASPEKRGHNRLTQMIIGHYDTVWPIGTIENMPFRIDGSKIFGPGIYDMKAGIAQAVFALETIQKLGFEPEIIPIIFFNSDEEIGSRDSTRYIRKLSRCMSRVFVLEPSLGLEGLIKTSRKGVGRFEIKVIGKAAHAGLDPEKGVSSILELSHIIQKLFALNDLERGISVNVGNIDGGLRPNVIAPESKAIVDVRVQSNDDGERIERQILTLKPETDGTQLQIKGGIGRPAFEPTERNRSLWRKAQAVAAELGIELKEGLAGGASDGNTTSQYTATLDGLGAVGGGAHAEHEFIDIDKTIDRIALLTILLLTPPIENLVDC